MFQHMKLGRIRKPVPASAPKLSRLMRTEIAPARVLRTLSDAFNPEMNANDRLSNCTAVGIANAIRAQAALAGYQISITTQQVIDFYSESTGYSADKPGSDLGGVEVDVLAYQLRHGFLGDAVTPWVGVWGTIPPDDLNSIRLAVAKLGCAYLGVNLALADQGGFPLDTTTPGDQTPGSWGGHALGIWAYDGTGPGDTVWLFTWGMIVPATWRWVRSRLDEAHGIAHRQILGPRGVNVAGLNWDAMAAECESFSV